MDNNNGESPNDSEWLAAWIRQAAQLGVDVNLVHQSVFEELALSNSSTDKNVRERALKCWSLWIDNVSESVLDSVEMAKVVAQPLVVSLEGEKDISDVVPRLQLHWRLLVKAQRSLPKKGPCSILQLLVASCLNIMMANPDIGDIDHLKTLALTLLAGLYDTRLALAPLHRPHFDDLTSPLSASPKQLKNIGKTVLVAFAAWKTLKDRGSMIYLWQVFLSHMMAFRNGKWVHADFDWHSAVQVLLKSCCDPAVPIADRLRLLHTAVKSVKPCLLTSKFTNPLWTVGQCLHRALFSLCHGVECSGCDPHAHGLLFWPALETAAVLWPSTESLSCLDSVKCLSLHWALWCGVSKQFMQSVSPRLVQDLSQPEMVFYRKLRGSAVNFDLDEPRIAPELAVTVKESIAALHINLYPEISKQLLVKSETKTRPEAVARTESEERRHQVTSRLTTGSQENESRETSEPKSAAESPVEVKVEAIPQEGTPKSTRKSRSVDLLRIDMNFSSPLQERRTPKQNKKLKDFVVSGVNRTKAGDESGTEQSVEGNRKENLKPEEEGGRVTARKRKSRAAGGDTCTKLRHVESDSQAAFSPVSYREKTRMKRKKEAAGVSSSVVVVEDAKVQLEAAYKGKLLTPVLLYQVEGEEGSVGKRQRVEEPECGAKKQEQSLVNVAEALETRETSTPHKNTRKGADDAISPSLINDKDLGECATTSPRAIEVCLQGKEAIITMPLVRLKNIPSIVPEEKVSCKDKDSLKASLTTQENSCSLVHKEKPSSETPALLNGVDAIHTAPLVHKNIQPLVTGKKPSSVSLHSNESVVKPSLPTQKIVRSEAKPVNDSKVIATKPSLPAQKYIRSEEKPVNDCKEAVVKPSLPTKKFTCSEKKLLTVSKEVAVKPSLSTEKITSSEEKPSTETQVLFNVKEAVVKPSLSTQKIVRSEEKPSNDSKEAVVEPSLPTQKNIRSEKKPVNDGKEAAVQSSLPTQKNVRSEEKPVNDSKETVVKPLPTQKIFRSEEIVVVVKPSLPTQKITCSEEKPVNDSNAVAVKPSLLTEIIRSEEKPSTETKVLLNVKETVIKPSLSTQKNVRSEEKPSNDSKEAVVKPSLSTQKNVRSEEKPSNDNKMTIVKPSLSTPKIVHSEEKPLNDTQALLNGKKALVKPSLQTQESIPAVVPSVTPECESQVTLTGQDLLEILATQLNIPPAISAEEPSREVQTEAPLTLDSGELVVESPAGSEELVSRTSPAGEEISSDDGEAAGDKGKKKVGILDSLKPSKRSPKPQLSRGSMMLSLLTVAKARSPAAAGCEARPAPRRPFNLNRTSRAARMLALLPDPPPDPEPQPETPGECPEDCEGPKAWQRYSPTNKEPGPSVLKSSKPATPATPGTPGAPGTPGTPSRKSIKFDDDRNETVVYPIETRPVMLQDFRKIQRERRRLRPAASAVEGSSKALPEDLPHSPLTDPSPHVPFSPCPLI